MGVRFVDEGKAILHNRFDAFVLFVIDQQHVEIHDDSPLAIQRLNVCRRQFELTIECPVIHSNSIILSKLRMRKCVA